MFSTILIIISGTGLSLVLLDIFSSDAEKSALTNYIIRAWTVLDDLKKTRWLDRLRGTKTLILLAAAPSIGAFLIWAYFNRASRSDDFFDIGFISVVAIINLGIGYLFIRLILNATTLVRASIRATLFLAVALAPIVLVSWFALSHLSYRSQLTVVGEPTLLQMLWVMSFIFATFVTSGLVIAWASVAVPLAIILVLQIVLVSAEFVLRRLAEYPRGPIVAVMLLVGAIGVFIKALS